MEWTKELPTKEGYYWRWFDADVDCFLIEIKSVSGVLHVFRKSRITHPVAQYDNCWWYGPLEKPGVKPVVD